MSEPLTEAGCRLTKDKLAGMEQRLAELRQRTDVHASVRNAAERSYLDTIRQYRREIRQYELSQVQLPPGAPAATSSDPANPMAAK